MPFECKYVLFSFRILIDPRRKAKKLTFRGLFPGAKVSRGPDWNYGDQDSGEKKHGKIIEIQDWSKTHPRSAAYVVWDNDRENLYRAGFNGMVSFTFEIRNLLIQTQNSIFRLIYVL